MGLFKELYVKGFLFQLFELLGFDRFELIQTLLENRERLLYAATREPESAKATMPRKNFIHKSSQLIYRHCN